MAYVGGFRERLIKESLANFIEDGLTQLGWYNTGREHKPVTVTGGEVDPSNPVEPNKISVSFEDEFFMDMEMGSGFEENRHAVVVDIYAESLAIGQHLKGDVLDLLRGKFTAISSRPSLDVYDITQVTPPVLFVCDYENFEVERNRSWETAHNEFWWSIAVDVIDYYTDDTD